MVRAASGINLSALENGKLSLWISGKKYRLTFPQAFVLGYDLAHARKYEAAARVFAALAHAEQYSDPARIMLARCRAGLKDYAGCSALLENTVGSSSGKVADELHAAFVYQNWGLRTDALRQLGKIAAVRPDLPVTYLLQGELWAGLGRRRNAALCWQEAIRRDRAGGAVAATARRKLWSLRKSTQDGRPRTPCLGSDA